MDKQKRQDNLFSVIFLIMWIILIMSGTSEGAWSGCDLVLTNDTDVTMTYHVSWLDHGIEKYKGYWIPRCCGELKPGESTTLSDFLGVGRHEVKWYVTRESKPPIIKLFKVGLKTSAVGLMPSGVVTLEFRR